MARSSVSVTSGLKALLILLTAALIGVVSWNLRDTTVHEGDKAPPFSVKTDQGRQVTPENFGGKVLVLNFWATWCQPCVTEIPSLNAFEKQFRDQGVVVLGVSIDKNEDKYHRFLKRFQVGFDTYRDPSATISSDYGTFQIPETYIIKDGTIRRKFVADQNWVSDDVEQYVKSLL